MQFLKCLSAYRQSWLEGNKKLLTSVKISSCRPSDIYPATAFWMRFHLCNIIITSKVNANDSAIRVYQPQSIQPGLAHLFVRENNLIFFYFWNDRRAAPTWQYKVGLEYQVLNVWKWAPEVDNLLKSPSKANVAGIENRNKFDTFCLGAFNALSPLCLSALLRSLTWWQQRPLSSQLNWPVFSKIVPI